MARPPPSSQSGKSAGARHALRGGSAKAKASAKPARRLAAANVATAVAAFPAAPRMIPTRWVKLVAAVLLLPANWIISRTFFEEFTRATFTHHFWRTEEFYFFALGALLWLIAFVGLPRPLVVYVFGHEVTHALLVWAQGGEVMAFEVRHDGGYIIADRRDFIVSLAPYFFPIYSIAVIGLYGAVGLFYADVWLYHRWFFALLGITWAFHLTFTCWMIPKQQTDLLLHGTFFSLVVIYLANLLVLSVLLVAACPQVTWAQFGADLTSNAGIFSTWVLHLTGIHSTGGAWLQSQHRH